MAVTMTNETQTPPPTTGRALEIANGIAGVYKDALGSGPSKARVSFASPDMVLVMLEHTMTVEEHTLAARGEDGRLRENRLVITAALEPRFRSIVEHALGRRTLAFLSGLDTRQDLAVDMFTLAPESPD